MKMRWRILTLGVYAKVENVTKVAITCCVLHNYLRALDPEVPVRLEAIGLNKIFLLICQVLNSYAINVLFLIERLASGS